MASKLIYLCGPITGQPNGNRLLFDKAERFYINRGHCIVNPHSYADFFGDVPESVIVREELATIACHIDVIALLPGWENSRYGLVEVAVGVASGIKFIEAFSFKPIKPSLKLRTNGTTICKELA